MRRRTSYSGIVAGYGGRGATTTWDCRFRGLEIERPFVLADCLCSISERRALIGRRSDVTSVSTYHLVVLDQVGELLDLGRRRTQLHVSRKSLF